MELSQNYLCVIFGVLLIVSCATCRPLSEDSSVLVAEDTGDSDEVTPSSPDCQSGLTARIENCLFKFEQLYVTYQNSDTQRPAYRADLVSRMCLEYEETLHCLHLVLMSCTPGQPHLNLIEYRIGSQEMRNFFQVTCDPTVQRANRPIPTTTAKPMSTSPEVEDTTPQTVPLSNDMSITDRTTAAILQESTTSSTIISREAAEAQDSKHKDLAAQRDVESEAENPNFTLGEEDGYIKFEIDQPRNDIFLGSSSLTDSLDCSLTVNQNKEACKDGSVNLSTACSSSLLLTTLALLFTCIILHAQSL